MCCPGRGREFDRGRFARNVRTGQSACGDRASDVMPYSCRCRCTRQRWVPGSTPVLSSLPSMGRAARFLRGGAGGRMAGDGTGRTRRQDNGPASGVLTRGRLDWNRPGLLRQRSFDRASGNREAVLAAWALKYRRQRSGCALRGLSAMRGAERLPTKKERGRSVPRRSSLLVRYRASRCLSALGALPRFALLERTRGCLTWTGR